MRSFIYLALLVSLSETRDAFAQRPQNSPSEDEVGTRFFDQLRSLFGRFRDSELNRAFDAAQPIPCSELVSDTGEWRPVAFFNEDRRLGDWFHASLVEVKEDLSQFIFSGPCDSGQSSVELVTKFPVLDSIERYNDGRIHFSEIRVNVNRPVRASFDPAAQVYSFELPFLYAKPARNTRETVYSLIAQHAEDRYASDVTNHWRCKSVRALDVTFQFLICQTWTSPRAADPRRPSRASYGASAYFILSDGKEASTSVKLSFNTGEGDNGQPDPVPGPSPPPRPATEKESGPLANWQILDPSSKLSDVAGREFRIRFDAQVWKNKIGSMQILMNQEMGRIDFGRTSPGRDYCVWRPVSVDLAGRVLETDPDKNVAYSLTTADGSRQSPPSIVFGLKTYTGSRIGTLECFFPRAESAGAITLQRWISTVGTQVSLEVAP